MRQKKLVPLYHQVYLTLRNALMSGSLGGEPGEPPRALPSENELADRYAVSRVTIRQALKTLEGEGLVIRRHGVGTFPAVTLDKQTERTIADTGSVYDDLAALTRDYDQKIISYARMNTPHFILKNQPEFGERCLYLAVVDKRDKTPVHLNRQYVPEQLGALLGKRRPGQPSLLLELRKHGVTASSIELELTATAADLDMADHLEVPVGAPLFVTIRIARDAEGNTVEHFETYSRPDLYAIRMQSIDINSSIRHVFKKSILHAG